MANDSENNRKAASENNFVFSQSEQSKEKEALGTRTTEVTDSQEELFLQSIFQPQDKKSTIDGASLDVTDSETGTNIYSQTDALNLDADNSSHENTINQIQPGLNNESLSQETTEAKQFSETGAEDNFVKRSNHFSITENTEQRDDIIKEKPDGSTNDQEPFTPVSQSSAALSSSDTEYQSQVDENSEVVASVNNAPILESQVVSVDEGEVLINGQLNSIDIDEGSTSSYSITEGGNSPDGFMLNTDGSYTFDPTDTAYEHLNVGVSQILTIPVTVTDDQGAKDTSQLQITVTGTNDVPIISSTQTIQQTEESLEGFTGYGETWSGDIYSVISQEEMLQHLNITDPDNSNFTVTLANTDGGNNWYGGLGATDSTFDNPTSDRYDETVVQVTQAFKDSYPQVDAEVGDFYFDNVEFDQLGEGEVANISFAVQVSDGKSTSEPQTMNVQITGTNDTPVITVVDTTATEDISQVIATASDIDGTIDTSLLTAEHGTVVLAENGEISYTPDADFNGTDIVSISVTDNSGAATIQSISLTVDAENDNPVAVNDSAFANEDTSLRIDTTTLLANDEDVDGDTLTITEVTATESTHGTVELVNKVAFEDDFDGNNTDDWTEISFNGRALGGWDNGDGAIGEQSNSARGILAHEMGGHSISTDFSVSVDINANTGDTYNNGVGLVFGYEDSNNYYQASWDNYSTSYDTSDSHKDFNLIKVVDGVKTVLDTVDTAELPNEFNLNVSVDENGISIKVDGNEMLASIDQPELGAVGLWTYDNDRGISYDNVSVTSGTAGQAIQFTPEANYNGEASFEYTVSDGQGGTDTATVSLAVDAVNDISIVGKVDLGAIKEDSGIKFSAKELLVNSTDADGDTLHVIDISVDEKYGSVEFSTDREGNIETVKFTPAENYHGDDVPLNFVTSDGHEKVEGTANIDVTAVNDTTVVGKVDLGAIKEDSGIKFSAKELLVNSSDADGDTLQVGEVSGDEKYGIVEFSTDREGNVETVKFTPAENYHGDDVPLNFVTSDGHEKVEGTANIDVTAVNDTTVVGKVDLGVTRLLASNPVIADKPAINEIRGTSNHETLNGTGENDHIQGEGGNDTINAGLGNDTILGGDGKDTLNGGAGNDTFIQNAGDDYDVFNGGEGTDTVIRGSGDGDIGISGNFGTENSIEAIDAGGNNIVGDSNHNTLDFSKTELNNVDEIHGGGGNDTITGTSGDDIILGGDGKDTLSGGAGNDTFIQNVGDDHDVFNGGEGKDTVIRGSGDGDIGISGNFGAENSIETIDAGGNNIVGDSNHNTLNFSKTELNNVDEIHGGGGNDTITGSSGDDAILGDSGHDTLKGGDGDDTLNGGSGNDIAYGEEGNDTYTFNPFDGSDTFHGGEGGGWTDTIQLSSNPENADSPWTISIDGNQVDFDMDAGALELQPDTSGVITMVDGSELAFEGVERIEW
jgi:VCBS repeat-containing protein